VVIDLRLLDAATEEVLWAEHFDKPVGEVMALHNEMGRALAAQLGLVLTAEVESRLAADRSFNGQAIDLYLKGNELYARQDPPSYSQALGYYQQARDLEPEFAPAWAGIANVHSSLGAYLIMPPEISQEQARSHAARAIEIDPGEARAYIVSGWVKMVYDWDWEGARLDFQQAVRLEPGSAYAHQSYGNMLVHYGEFETGLQELRRAVDLDPRSLISRKQLGEGLMVAGRLEEAREVFDSIIAADPRFLVGHVFAAMNHTALGHADEAVEAAETAVALAGRGVTFPLIVLADAYDLAGRDADYLDLMAELEATTAYIDPAMFGLLQWGAGDVDEAFVSFQKALDTRAGMLMHLPTSLQGIPELQGDPRIHDIMAEVGLEHMLRLDATRQ
jgi:tetratricopeptide (TPR) repeat protein